MNLLGVPALEPGRARPTGRFGWPRGLVLALSADSMPSNVSAKLRHPLYLRKPVTCGD
jgi:hypothetical protein